MKRLISAVPVVLGLIGVVAYGQADPTQTPPTKIAKPPAPRLTFAQRTKLYLQKLGATVDATKSSDEVIASSYTDPKGGRTTIVVTGRKNFVGFYIYGFGSVKNATNKEEIFKYLLSTNDAITLGSFFVDSDDDIGYKYLVSGTSIPANEFDTIYLTMAAVARERRSEILRLLGPPPSRDDRPPDVKKAGDDRPPVQ